MVTTTRFRPRRAYRGDWHEGCKLSAGIVCSLTFQTFIGLARLSGCRGRSPAVVRPEPFVVADEGFGPQSSSCIDPRPRDGRGGPSLRPCPDSREATAPRRRWPMDREDRPPGHTRSPPPLPDRATRSNARPAPSARPYGTWNGFAPPLHQERID